jgi:hypothetical protein
MLQYDFDLHAEVKKKLCFRPLQMEKRGGGKLSILHKNIVCDNYTTLGRTLIT